MGDGDSHRARPASRATELGRRLRRGDRGTPSEARTGQGGGVLGTEGAGDSHDPQRSRAHTRVLGTRTTLGFLTEKGPHAPAVWASLRPFGGLAQAGSLSAPPAPAPPWASSLPPRGPAVAGPPSRFVLDTAERIVPPVSPRVGAHPDMGPGWLRADRCKVSSPPTSQVAGHHFSGGRREGELEGGGERQAWLLRTAPPGLGSLDPEPTRTDGAGSDLSHTHEHPRVLAGSTCLSLAWPEASGRHASRPGARPAQPLP